MKATTARVYPRVSTDGTGVVSHAGSALLRELADRVGLRAEFAAAVGQVLMTVKMGFPRSVEASAIRSSDV